MQPSNSISLKKPLLLLIIITAGYVIFHFFFLHGAKFVQLHNSPQLTGQISQSLITSADSAPQAGHDYTLVDTAFFDNNMWAVTTLKPVTSDFSQGTVLLQKRSGIFQVVLGPGTLLPKNSLVAVPDDVTTYLYKQGVVGE
jgi:hypothetical protein